MPLFIQETEEMEEEKAKAGDKAEGYSSRVRSEMEMKERENSGRSVCRPLEQSLEEAPYHLTVN